MAQDVGAINDDVSARPRSVIPISDREPSWSANECQLWAEFQQLKQLVVACESEIAARNSCRLPGNIAFLSDGRVLCRERNRGDSRYPYGFDGFNLWVTASGYIHCNQGLYFLFLPAQEGQQPPIAFLAGAQLPGTGEFLPLSLLPVPFLSDAEARIVERYTVIGHDAAYFVTETPELLGVVRVFLAQTRPQHAHLHISLLLQNRTKQSLGIYTSAYMNPFCRHQLDESSEDRWFKEIRVVDHPPQVRADRDLRDERGVALPTFLVRTNEDVSRFCSMSNYALLRRSIGVRSTETGESLRVLTQQDLISVRLRESNDVAITLDTQECTSQLAYFGSPRRNLACAAFLRTGSLPQTVERTVFNENSIIGDLLRTELPIDGYLRADYLLSIPENEDVIELELTRPVDPCEVDAALEQLRRRIGRPGNLSLEFQGTSWHGIDVDTFNHFLPFLKKQVAVCANIHGYLQRSANSLIGFRDVFQALEGHLLDRPLEARSKILEALSMVLIDGRCPRQYSLSANGRPGKFDLREFVDQGIWAVSAVYNYLAATGDTAILDELLGYQTLKALDENACEPATERDTVFEHLLRIIDYLIRQRDQNTGLVRALYGDWNDALDGLGVSDDPGQPFGTGVSVMTSLQLLQSCQQMVEIIAHFVPTRSGEIKRYQQVQEKLRDNLRRYAIANRGDCRRILHGWGDGRRYEVGGYHDCDGATRDALTVNAFWVLADMLDADVSLRPHVLAAFQRLDSPFGFKTFAPGFGPDAVGVGRINRLPIGTAENGAVYLHATAFAIAALFRMGEAKRAWQQIAKILPFAPHHKHVSHSPFVMPNSYVHNPQLNLNGQSMNDWQTGASNVLLKLLVRYVVGFQPDFEHLRIAPAAWMPFDGFEFGIVVRNKKLRIAFRRADVAWRNFIFNGVAVTESIDEDNMSTINLRYETFRERVENRLEIIDSIRLG